MEVTACLVTRGDVDLSRILESLPPKWELVVYDNSGQITVDGKALKTGRATVPDLGVYGRYEAMYHAKTDVVYVQDDDCILAPDSFRSLERNFEEGVITTNMPAPFRAHYSDSCLIGFGAIFEKHLPMMAFGKLTREVGMRILDPKPRQQFLRTCDVYFTALTPIKMLDLEYENLPWATDVTRMYRQDGHVGERAKALEHARSLR